MRQQALKMIGGMLVIASGLEFPRSIGVDYSLASDPFEEVTALEHDYLKPRVREPLGGCKARQPGSDYDGIHLHFT